MQTAPDITTLELGRQVIVQGAKALVRVAQGLGRTFEQSVDLLLRTRGRIAVTGMGKSGHIARKIAATLSSTGSPAYFIHPAEASHGDLGMLADGDTLIAISNSGNTVELSDILSFATRGGIPVIAITGRCDSRLGRIADLCLELPHTGEACPLDCAPTTSTTMELALGDALALAILKARGFTVEEFSKYHPGGALGKKLKTVGEVMCTGDDLPLVHEDTSMGEVICVMTGKGFGCAGVVNADGELVGIITDGDLRRHMNSGLIAERADEVMTRNPVVVEADCLTTRAIKIMEQNKISSLFVVDRKSSSPLGFINIHSLIYIV